MSEQALPFRKMNGLGNDFVILDARKEKIELTRAQVLAIANRETGIGCDQLLILESSAKADIFMRIYNADGSEASGCGNGTRCVARLIMDKIDKDAVRIDTKGGILNAKRVGEHITVDMGMPKLKWDEIPLAEPFHDTRAIELQIGPIDAPLLHSPAVVNVGNPHAIFFVDDLNCIDLSKAGPLLETHPIFPERANISLARVDARNAMTLKVWERGAGLTKACGTAACAATVAAIRKRLTDRIVNVRLPGGVLNIEWRTSDDHILMAGPADFDFDGIIPAELLNETASAG